MPSVTITDPESGDPFPATVTGTYDLGGGMAAVAGGTPGDPPPVPAFTIELTVTRPGESHGPYNAVITPGGGTGGTWSCGKPNGLSSPVNDYTITAELDDGSAEAVDQVTNISN